MATCRFIIWYVGACGKPVTEGHQNCPEHTHQCASHSCANDAITECPQTVFGLHCGQPVCSQHRDSCGARH